jgi:CheY-like chemotaxis protein
MDGNTGMESGYNKMRILAIDDEPIIRLVSMRVLTAEGFNVDVACNGLIAKNMTSTVKYDLYLSDIRTPEMNGMEFYEYLKQAFPGQESRVIFTTGDTMSLEVKDFLSKKNNLFLAKPFTPEELRAVFRKAVTIGVREIQHHNSSGFFGDSCV